MREIPPPFHFAAVLAKAITLRVTTTQVQSSVRATLSAGAWRRRLNPHARLALGALLVAAAYYVSTLIGLSVRFESSPISPIWPPNTILLVALLLVPMRTWWAYLLAVFGAHLLVDLPNGIPLVTALGLYVTNTAEAVVGAYLVRRLTDGSPWLGTMRRVVIYVVCAVIVAPVLTSFADAAVVVLTHWGENYWLNWEARTVSNSLAELTIGPALLLALTVTRGGMRNASRWRRVETALLALGVVLVSTAVFSGDISWRGSTPALVYAVLPLLLWAAIRFGARGTSFALLGITVLATWSAAQGNGPFSTHAPAEDVISLQVYLIGISVPMLLLAGLMQEHRGTEETLQESEARYRDLVESQKDMICRYLPDSTLTFVNQAFCRFYGKPRHQLIGTKFLDLMDDAAHNHHTQYIKALLDGAAPSMDEHEITLPDGSVGWQQWIDHTIRDATGNIVEIQAVGRDITDRRQAEEALQESEARFRAAFESAATGMMLVDSTGRALKVNRPLAEMLGYSQEELLSYPFAEITHPDDVDANLTLFRRTVAGEIDSYQLEKRFIHKQGHLVWAIVSAGVVRDAMGQPRYLIGQMQDITERKRIEEALRASEERYRAVVNNFPHGVVLLFEQDLRHVFADGQGLPDIGLSRETIEGKTVWEAFPANLSATLAPKYQAALAGTSDAFDLSFAGHTYQTHVLPIDLGGATEGMAILQDVTEQRRVEVLAELDRAKTAFLSNVSHEFRTPLTLLLGPAADALADREEPLAPRQRQRMELIQRGGRRLHKLVDNLLEFSRIESGHVRATYEPTDVAALSADLASAFRSAAERAGLRLAVECGALDELPQSVYVDRDMWEQIVLNLISNALKFTFEGEIAVTVRAAAERDDWVELEVRDTGTGIPAEELPHLFERFYRVQGAHGRTTEGTGIGLALVQELVRLHGGTVRVKSTLGEGSTFTVALPMGDAHLPSDRVVRQARHGDGHGLAMRRNDAIFFAAETLERLPASPQSSVTSPASPAVTDAARDGHDSNGRQRLGGEVALEAHDHGTAAQPPHTGRATILVADDNADMRAYLVRLLSEEWEVRAVANGLAALDAAREHHPDLILADVFMPELDGFELVAALRENPQTHALPIILLSARAGDGATVEGLQAGADDYLIKPFSSRELLARVQTHLELARARRDAEAHAAELDAILNAIGDGVLVCDRGWQAIHANHAYRGLLRRSLDVQGHQVEPEALIAGREEWERYLAITDEQGHVVSKQEWATERALRGETLTGVNAIDQFLRGADGNVLQLNVSAAPICSAEGQITGSVAVFRDVTERRRLERQVAEQASQLEAIFEAIGDGVLVQDLDGHGRHANRAFRELLGRHLELRGRPVKPDALLDAPAQWEDQIAPADEQGRAIPRDEWATERALRGEVLTGVHAVDEFTWGANGEILQLNVSAAPIHDSDGRITGAVAVFRDVTERRRLERQVAEQASHLEAVFEAKADGIAVFDRRGRFVHANQALREIFGMDADADYISRSLSERAERLTLLDEQGQRIPEAQWPQWRVLRGEILAGASAMDMCLQALDGREVWISTSGAPIRGPDGRVTGVVLVTRDVTARRELERKVAEQASQLQAVFDAMTDGVFVLDEEGRVTSINSAGRRLVGLADDAPAHATAEKRARALGMRSAEGQPLQPDELPTVRLLRGEELSGPTTPMYTMTLPLCTGEDRTVSLTGAPLRDANSGRIYGAVAVFRDVTELKQAQTALAEQERLFRTLVENSPDIITRFDRNLRHRYVSPASEAVLGIVPDTRLNKTYAELGLPEEAYAPWEAALREVLATGERRTFESGYSAEGKPPCISRVTYVPEFAADGSVESVLGITTDITDLKRTEAALRQSEERFAKAFHNSPTAMAIVSQSARRIVDVNTAQVLLTGYSRDELLGASIGEIGLIVPADLDTLSEQWQEGECDDEVSVRVRTKFGETRSCLCSMGLIQVGNEPCMIVTTRDVTDSERAEEALRQSEERFAKAFHDSPIAMTITSRATRRILDANAAHSRLTGYSHGELVGATIAELRLLSPTYSGANSGAYHQRARREGGVVEIPIHIQTKFGETRSCLQSMGFISVGGEPCVITTLRDVTERERAEEALRAAKAAAEVARREEEQRRREAERRERIAASLREILAILNSDRQIDKTLDYITRQVGQLLSSDAAAIYMTDDGATLKEASGARAAPASLALHASYGLRPALTSSRGKHRLSVGDAAVRQAMDTRRPVAVLALPVMTAEGASMPQPSDAEPALREPFESIDQEEPIGDDAADYIEVRKELLPTPYRALLAIPIITQGQAYGSLLLLYTAPRRFSADEVALAMAYGDQIALAVANARLQEHIGREATENERNRLARELHDTVTQEIFTASVLAESIPRVWERHRPEAEANLLQVYRLTRSALAALRALLLELRPKVLEEKPLDELLRQLQEVMATRADVPIELSITDDCPPIPIAVKVAFYRIAQEALMNAAKYASAQHIAVRLRYQRADGAIQLEVHDDGQGFDAGAIPAGHFGLGMMRERARAAGALLRITSRPEQGTRIAVKWSAKERAAPTSQEYAATARTRRGSRT